ncbi:MAG: succinate dehydrogenase, cytochrome b556 subunit [Xanthomonadales bacterium]|nr:succinate dehydrogenase, cytochrome b556 subunit [Xanthomonadales bacterium]
MSTSKRPMSPYMLGPYYKFQITSVLSILNRLTGVFMSVVTLPLLLCWLIALASGADEFAAVSAWLGSGLGKLVIAASVFSFSFHLFGGIRHLIWDAGWMMEMPQVRMSGWLAIIGSVVLTLIVIGAGL